MYFSIGLEMIIVIGIITLAIIFTLGYAIGTKRSFNFLRKLKYGWILIDVLAIVVGILRLPTLFGFCLIVVGSCLLIRELNLVK